ncbi:hypothetical protein BH23BAC1_BH23BAC1_20000 [soil metagenome]
MQRKKLTVEDLMLDESFRKWVSNDPEMKIYWEEWLKMNPDQIDIVEKAKQNLKLLALDKDEHFKEELVEVWDRINITIESAGTESINSSKLANSWYKWAAVFAGLLGLGAFIFSILQIEHQKFNTSYGETKELFLPDSSKITLNANSTIAFKKNWKTGQIREVWLEGEAFFEVKKQKLEPDLPKAKFVVHANELNVEVLGTEFNVNNRRGLVKVILNSGEIKLNSKSEKILMKPGDMVEYSPTEKFIQKLVEPEKLTSWRFQKIIFDKATLHEISQVIEDNYGVSIEFSEASLANRNFTGVVSYQDLDLFLAILAESLNLNIIKKQEKILINERKKF